MVVRLDWLALYCKAEKQYIFPVGVRISLHKLRDDTKIEASQLCIPLVNGNYWTLDHSRQPRNQLESHLEDKWKLNANSPRCSGVLNSFYEDAMIFNNVNEALAKPRATSFPVQGGLFKGDYSAQGVQFIHLQLPGGGRIKGIKGRISVCPFCT